MTKDRFSELTGVCGKCFPSFIYEHSLPGDGEGSCVLSETELKNVLDCHSVPEDRQLPVLEALVHINAIPELVELSLCAARVWVRALADGTAGELDQPKPSCLNSFDRSFFGFIFSQLLAKEGRLAMKARAIPETYWKDIPEEPTRRAIRKYLKNGIFLFSDYQWDVNYFGCGIFLLGRFLFIPYRWEEGPLVFKSDMRFSGRGDAVCADTYCTGRGDAGNSEISVKPKVKVLWKSGTRVRTDGQIDGVNRISDPRSFVTKFTETDGFYEGDRVSETGLITRKTEHLDKALWTPALKENDPILALHIPDGPGYDPEHLHESCRMARDFFDRYYPELGFKAIQSESWLFDPLVSELLGPNRRITRVRNEFHCYPTEAGDSMSICEIFHTSSHIIDTYPLDTTLQRLTVEALRSGKRLHCTSAFMLKEEI